MRVFTCLFKDNRYNAPTLSFFLTEDEDRARDLAWRAVEANPHYLDFEICEGERTVAAGPQTAMAAR